MVTTILTLVAMVTNFFVVTNSPFLPYLRSYANIFTRFNLYFVEFNYIERSHILYSNRILRRKNLGFIILCTCLGFWHII